MGGDSRMVMVLALTVNKLLTVKLPKHSLTNHSHNRSLMLNKMSKDKHLLLPLVCPMPTLLNKAKIRWRHTLNGHSNIINIMDNILLSMIQIMCSNGNSITNRFCSISSRRYSYDTSDVCCSSSGTKHPSTRTSTPRTSTNTRTSTRHLTRHRTPRTRASWYICSSTR